MNTTLQRRPIVEQDLQDHFVFLGRRSVEIAERFLAAAEETFQAILAMPGLGGLCEADNPQLVDVRVKPIRRFENYIVFYRSTPTGVEIIRVLHGAQDLDRAFAPES